jgi:hypothetical protein
MNIVTGALAKRLKNHHLKDWIAHWDALEALVIRVYKGKKATSEDETEYRRLRAWLTRNYPRWQAALRPHWQQSLLAGEPALADPFTRLFSALQAADFAGDWSAMQTLPAAREALNRYLLELQERSSTAGQA